MRSQIDNGITKAQVPTNVESTIPQDAGDLFPFEQFLQKELKTINIQRRLDGYRLESDTNAPGENTQLQEAVQEDLDDAEEATEKDPEEPTADSDKENNLVPTPTVSQTDG